MHSFVVSWKSWHKSLQSKEGEVLNRKQLSCCRMLQDLISSAKIDKFGHYRDQFPTGSLYLHAYSSQCSKDRKGLLDLMNPVTRVSFMTEKSEFTIIG